MKRVLAMLLLVAMLLCWSFSALGEENDEEAILDQVAELEASLGELRVIELHIREEGEETDPDEMDTPEKTWLTALGNALEARWDTEGEEQPDFLDPGIRTKYKAMAEAEMEILQQYREIPLDPLLDLLRDAYMNGLQKQVDVCEEISEQNDGIPTGTDGWEKAMADRLANLVLSAFHVQQEQEAVIKEIDQNLIDLNRRWNGYRQESLKSLYFINRYYGVPVDEAYRPKIHSNMYEGALLINEHTVADLIEARSAEKQEEIAEAHQEVTKIFGPEIWHADAAGEYELRIYDLNIEEMAMTLELRVIGDESPSSTSKISLSQWEKYVKGRYSLGTFYQVDHIESAGGKISFVLHLNVMVDGRLYREVKGKISLPISGAAPRAGQTETSVPSQTPINGSTEGTQDIHGSAPVSTEQVQTTVQNQEFDEDPFEQDFTALKVGNVIRMGYYEQDGNVENLREPIEWKVISVNKKKNVALVTSVYALESIPFGTAGDEEEYTKAGLNWKTSGIREWLNEEFYRQCFTEAERKRIRQVSNVTKDPSGRFTTKDYVFLLSQIEAKRYFGRVEKLKCEATPYVMEKLGSDSPAIAADGYCLWWVREMTRAVKVNRNGEIKKNTVNEAGYVYGSRGLAMFLRKIGAKTYEENVALVRPAMWIKFDAAPKE